MKFSRYQKFVIFILAFIQFTVILDFMILAPLGALLLKDLNIGTAQFGLVVSAYAFSAGASGLLTAGFADKFDRKKLLLFFYSGFVFGTLLCGIATSHHFLLVARIIAGLFGGVIGSIAMAIIADLFPLEVRGRVMGVVQTAFAASQVLGIPVGLLLSNHWGWQAPFLMIAVISLAVGVVIVLYLKPIDRHLTVKSTRSPFQHLLKTLANRSYLKAFTATVLLSTGGFMLMPFGSAFTVYNMGIALDKLPLIYLITGGVSILAGPLVGRLIDRKGSYRVFVAASISMIATVLYYCSMGITPLWGVILINVMIFVCVLGRMISSQTLTSGVPDLNDRGAFMAINVSVQQISGGIAAAVAGMIVVQRADGVLDGYPTLGYVVSVAMLITMVLMYSIHKLVKQKNAAPVDVEITTLNAEAV